MQRTPDIAGVQAAPAPWSLATLQSRMAKALLAADDAGRELPAALFAGALPGAEGLRVHRNTILGGLSHALRQTYPAIDRLVGEAFFDRMAVEFSRVHLPRAPQLGSWGRGFADFIDGFPGTANLPYLRALAQFDARFDELARRVPDDRHAGVAVPLHGELNLYFTAGLLLHSANYPVAALREAILADDAVALAAIDLACGEQHYAMWRAAAGVMVQPLGAAAARYLHAVLDGRTGEQALAAALAAGDSPEAEVAAQLQREILQARFVRVATDNDTNTGTGR
jgi:hypothetical protein